MIPTHKISIQLPEWRTEHDMLFHEVYRRHFSPDAAARGQVVDGNMYFMVVGEPDEPLLRALRKYGTVTCEKVAID